jgi:hypothetical protein
MPILWSAWKVDLHQFILTCSKWTIITIPGNLLGHKHTELCDTDSVSKELTRNSVTKKEDFYIYPLSSSEKI